MRVTRRQFTRSAASLLMLSTVGCANLSNDQESKLSLMDRMPWSKDKQEVPEPYPNPVKIASTWTPDTLVQMGRTPTRGFGGRIFFYDEKTKAVPVDGTLIVHGFNDKAESKSDAVKRFEFTPEQLTKHFDRTDLGASYSIWIPWDAMGGQQKRITLVTSFKTAEGRMVQGVPATVMLPGHAPPTTSEDQMAIFSPDYRKYQQAAQPSAGLTTTTIRRTRIKGATLEQTAPSKDLMIAGQSQTPSGEVLSLQRRPKSPLIQPVSAQEPVRR